MDQTQQQQRIGGGGPGNPGDRPPDPVGSRVWARLGAGLLVFVSGLTAGGLAVYLGLERPALDAAQARIQQYQHEVTMQRERLTEVGNRAAALEGRLLVEEGTRRGLETSLRTLQEELGRSQDTVAFYEQLMPPGPKGAIAIRALDIERAGPHLKYRALLMRSATNDKAFKGELQFLASGMLAGKKTTIPLLPVVVTQKQDAQNTTIGAEPAQSPTASSAPDPNAAAQDPAGLLAVEFADFQRSSGVLGLPEGFDPRTVTVNVLEGRTVRTTRTVDLPAAN